MFFRAGSANNCLLYTSNVEGTGGAIDRYNEWQVAALGRDINPDQLRKRILSPSWGGVSKLEKLTLPLFVLSFFSIRQ